MKTKNVILLTTIVFLLSGCFIKSLYPFYTKKDIVYDPALIGSWLDNDSNRWIIQKQNGLFIQDTSSYQVDITERNGSLCNFNVHLFHLNNQLYLDFYPNGKIGSSDFVEANIVATHNLAKIEYTCNTIKIQWFNEVWLGQLLEQNKIRIRHEKISESDANGYSNCYLLTASTEELQKFIIKYGNDSLAFKSIWEGNPKEMDKEALTFNLKKISNETY